MNILGEKTTTRLSIILIFFLSITSRAELKTWDGSYDLWNKESHWTPTGVPTSNDNVLVTGGESVLVPSNGVCAAFEVKSGGFLIVNDTARTLKVIGNGTVSGSETQLRVNEGHLDVGGSITLVDDATMVLDAVTATASFNSLYPQNGTLEWNAGTLHFTDDLYMWSGNPISDLTVGTGRTLQVQSGTLFGNELSVGTGGILTLDGGAVTCDAFTKTTMGTFAFYDGTLTVNGDGFDWDGSTLEIEGSTSDKLAKLVLYDFALPEWVTLTNGIAIAPNSSRNGQLLLTAYSNLNAPGTIGNGISSLGEATISDVSTWKANTLTVGGAGTGILTIENTSRVQDCTKIEVGRDNTATGIVTVAGVGSQLSTYWETQIGGYGNAIIQVTNGAALLFEDQITASEFALYSGSRADIKLSDPGSQFQITSDAYSHTIYFGSSGHASLTVSNGASVVWDEFARVGETPSGRGDIIVTGTNSTWTINSDIWLGFQGTGTLQVLDGAVAHTDEAKLGEFPNGVGLVTVSGAGSVWHGGGIESIGGEFLIARYGRGELTIEKGGTVHSSGFSELGQYAGSEGYVTVTDAGSLWDVNDKLYVGFEVDGVTGLLTVANGGLVTVGDTANLYEGGTIVLNGGTQGSGTLDVKTLDLSSGSDITGDSGGILRVNNVTDRPTNWTLPGSLQIGSPNHSGDVQWTIDNGESLTINSELYIGYDKSVTLIVNSNSLVTANSIYISSNSFLTGNGVLCGDMTNEGTISPGLSAGTLTSTGTVELLSTSMLNMELSGTNMWDYDHMVVNGNLTPGGTLVVSLNGYTPSLGDRFDLLDWTTLTQDSKFDTLDLPTLPTGLEWATNTLYITGSIKVSLPLAWLKKYGLSPNDNPFGDPDDDLCSTADEYTADTNPTNGASYFQIDRLDVDDVKTVYFDSSSNRIYLLYGCTNLILNSWDAVPGSGPRIGVGSADTFSDTNEPAKGPFYRLGVQLQ